MPKRAIAEISQEQEAMLPEYRQKWRSFAISTESIDEEKVRSVIKAAYSVSDFSEPEILFFESPFAAIQGIFAIDDYKGYLGHKTTTKFHKRVIHYIWHGIEEKFETIIFRKLRNQIHFPEFPHYWTEDNPIIPYFPSSYEINICMSIQLINDLVNSEIEFADVILFK